MEFWKKVGQYWAFVISLILLAIITYFSVFYSDISKEWFILIITLSTITIFVDTLIQDDDFKRALERHNTKLDTQGKIIEKQIKFNEDFKTKKENALKLLNTLVNNSLIDREEINKPFETTKIFALYCFPTTLYIKKDNKIIYAMNKRLYPDFLKMMGFIKLHTIRGLFYIIQKDRLTNELQNTFALKTHLLTKIDEKLSEEWKIYLSKLKKSKRAILNKEYENLKGKNYKDMLLFNVLLLNTDIDENNIGYLNKKRAFGNDFHNFIKQQINLKEINIPKESKAKIVEFIKNISFTLFFYGEKAEVLRKLKSVEKKVKDTLDITDWREYLNKNNKDLADLIATAGFTEKTSLEYAKKLKKRVEDYSEALKELRISY